MSERLDLLRLHAEWDTTKWNSWLSRSSMSQLETMMRAAQVGIAHHERKKETTPELNAWYCRILRSIQRRMEHMAGATSSKEKRDEMEKYILKKSY